MSAEKKDTLSDLNEGLHQAAQRLVASRKRSILLVEDTAAHAALIRRAIDQTIWDLEHVTRAKDALDRFSAEPEQIVLLDLSLPDCDGFKLLSQLRAHNPQAPIIVVTSTDQVNVSVEAMRKGAWDYVVKAEPNETSEQIRSAVERAWQQQLKSSESRLIEQSKIAELVRSERLEAIEVIVRTVCHEVNNPLSGVVALSQLLLNNKALDSDVQELADGILRSAKEVAEVVQKLNGIQDEPVESSGKVVFELSIEDSLSEDLQLKP